MEKNCKWTTFKEIKHLLPPHTWVSEYYTKDEFDDNNVLFVDGDLEIGNLDLGSPRATFEGMIQNDDNPEFGCEPFFSIIVNGSLKANNIFNEETDGSTGLTVLGNLDANNIVVGGQETYVTGDLSIKGLFWGNYNHGNIHIEGKTAVRVFLSTEQYDYTFGAGREGIEVFLSDDDGYSWHEYIWRSTVLDGLKKNSEALKEVFGHVEEEIVVPAVFDDVKMDSFNDLMEESKNFGVLFDKLILTTQEGTQIVDDGEWESTFMIIDEYYMLEAVRRDGFSLRISKMNLNKNKFIDSLVKVFSLFKKDTNKKMSRLIVTFKTSKHDKSRILFIDELSDKYLTHIKEYWTNLLANADKALYFKNLFDETIKPEQVLHLTSLPLITEKYNDWNYGDKNGDWFGNKTYNFRMNGFDDEAAMLRIGEEIKSEGFKFDMRFYFFKNDEIENPKKVELLCWSSQEEATDDCYSKTSKQVCALDWRKYKEAIHWFEKAVRKIKKANGDFLEELESNKPLEEQNVEELLETLQDRRDTIYNIAENEYFQDSEKEFVSIENIGLSFNFIWDEDSSKGYDYSVIEDYMTQLTVANVLEDGVYALFIYHINEERDILVTYHVPTTSVKIPTEGLTKYWVNDNSSKEEIIIMIQKLDECIEYFENKS